MPPLVQKNKREGIKKRDNGSHIYSFGLVWLVFVVALAVGFCGARGGTQGLADARQVLSGRVIAYICTQPYICSLYMQIFLEKIKTG